MEYRLLSPCIPLLLHTMYNIHEYNASNCSSNFKITRVTPPPPERGGITEYTPWLSGVTNRYLFGRTSELFALMTSGTASTYVLVLGDIVGSSSYSSDKSSGSAY